MPPPSGTKRTRSPENRQGAKSRREREDPGRHERRGRDGRDDRRRDDPRDDRRRGTANERGSSQNGARQRPAGGTGPDGERKPRLANSAILAYLKDAKSAAPAAAQRPPPPPAGGPGSSSHAGRLQSELAAFREQQQDDVPPQPGASPSGEASGEAEAAAGKADETTQVPARSRWLDEDSDEESDERAGETGADATGAAADARPSEPEAGVALEPGEVSEDESQPLARPASDHVRVDQDEGDVPATPDGPSGAAAAQGSSSAQAEAGARAFSTGSCSGQAIVGKPCRSRMDLSCG